MMGPRKDPHRPITKRKQLLVEGRTSELFLEVLAAHLAIQEIEIRDFRSNAELTPFLKAFCKRPEFKEQVASLGIIRDAEAQPAERAFQSVCASLRGTDQPLPASPGSFTQTEPKIGIFILPNCCDQGMLETLCLESVLTPSISKCIDEYFQCMETQHNPRPRNMTKAKTFAFLATKDISDPLVGRAAQKGIWPWDSGHFAPLRNFLLSL